MSEKLFVVLLGCKPENRNVEQHDVFFGVAKTIKDLIPHMQAFWPEAENGLHIDAYMPLEHISGYDISVVNSESSEIGERLGLFCINLGGYAPPEFEEYHKKLFVVVPTLSDAIAQAKTDPFYHDGVTVPRNPARSHVDDKIDVDEIINIQNKLAGHRIVIRKATSARVVEPPRIGYLVFSKL